VRASFVLAVGLAACGLPEGDYFGRTDRREPGTFRWCNSGEPDHLDPVLASSQASAPLLAPLFAARAPDGMDGLPVPSLATRWEISDDLRTFTFHLRTDARWSNGRPVTAYDVAYSAIRVLSPSTGSPNGDNIAPIRNAPGYLARKVYALGGDLVELVLDADAEPPDLAARTSSHELALRDLFDLHGAPYARVPAGTTVELIATTGLRATWPSPDGQAWAYVLWQRDVEGVYGWVPASALDGQPNGGLALRVQPVAGKDQPDGVARPPTVRAVHGRDLVATPDVLGIHALDAHTLVFECGDPTPYFLAAADNRALRTTPVEAVSRWPLTWTRPEHIVTSGPLHLASWRERDRLEMVRSPTYWDPAEVRSDRVVVLAMDDQAANANTYFAGDCDATSSNNIPSTYLPVMPRYKDYDVSPWLAVYFLWVQTEVVANRHLRRALSLAIDRTQIPRFTFGGEFPSAQLTPGTPIARLTPAQRAACGVAADAPGVALLMAEGLCYVPPPGLDYDLARAKAEVAQARAEGGVPAKLHYIFNAGGEAHKQIAEYLQAAWAAIGLDVEIEAHEWNAMLADTHAGRFEISRLGNIGNVADTESEFLALFHCGTLDNRGRYCSKEFERLMAEARPMRDRVARNAVLRRAEAVMIEDAPVIPLYVYTQKHLVKPYVRDFAINLVDQPPLWRVWIAP